MIAAIVLACAASAQAQAVVRLADVRAYWDGPMGEVRAGEGPTEKVEVGQPFEARLVAEHPRAARVALAGDGFAPDPDSWLVLEDRGARTQAHPSDPERALTTHVWELCSLEAGQREIEGPYLEISLEGAGKIVQIEALAVDVRAVLFPEEDAARELAGISAALPDARSASAWPWVLGALLLSAGAFAWVAWRRARRSVPEPAPTAAVRLAALETRPLDSPQSVQAAYYEVSHVLRGEYDRALGRDRAGLTDEEWLAASSAEVSRLGQGEEQRARLAELLHACGEVKYGQSRPTHWAVQETIGRARDLAHDLARRGEAREVAA